MTSLSQTDRRTRRLFSSVAEYQICSNVQVTAFLSGLRSSIIIIILIIAASLIVLVAFFVKFALPGVNLFELIKY
jgi:asparagine synthetase B (glutamine-hydrolysing)